MGRGKSKAIATITTERGNIYVDGARFDAHFRYPVWLFKLNPKLILPGLRRDHRKIVYINGRRFGKADYRDGCIPLESYRLRENRMLDKFMNFIRETFGIGCSNRSRGYYNIKLRTNTFVVVVRRSSKEYIRCIVYIRDSGDYVGDFMFDNAIENVYPRLVRHDLERTFCVIIGYIMDSLVYTTVALHLDRKLEIHC